MSQFWQNLHARLQPAVPNERTRRARVEVIERLLLDRVDAEARRAPVGREHHRVADALAHEARAALAFVQPAVARAQVALDAAVVEHVPPAAGIVAHRLDRSAALGHRRTSRPCSARRATSRLPEVAAAARPCASARRGSRAGRAAAPTPAAGTSRACAPYSRMHAVDARAAACASGLASSPPRTRLVAATSSETSIDVVVELVARERREARVAERGGDARSRATSSPSGRRALERCRCSRAARPRCRSVTKVAPGSRSQRRRRDGASAGRRAPSPIAARAIASSTRAAGQRSASARSVRERERRVADDARAVARGVAGVAQVEELRRRARGAARTASRPLTGVAPHACS